MELGLINTQKDKISTLFFMLQLIGACHYMQAHQVIHRDLKLGNLFLDGNMNVKVGDFGLAALIKREEKEDDLWDTRLHCTQGFI